MKTQYIIMSIIAIIIAGMMVSPFLDKWNAAVEMDKENICSPYMPSGFVAAYVGDEHCSQNEIKERKEFIDYYCDEYNCHPVLKTEKRMKLIYVDWKLSQSGKEAKQ